MNRPEKIVYTAKVHTTGGRIGSSRSDDGKLGPHRKPDASKPIAADSIESR
jgi:hypothetical protein